MHGVRRTLAASAGALSLAACGGDAGEQAASETTAAPRLPASLAEELARESDEAAGKLEAGDACGAVAHVVALRERADEAVAAGDVPRALRAPLLDAVERLEGQVACIDEEPADEDDEEDDEDKGNGKGKGKAKGKDKGADEEGDD